MAGTILIASICVSFVKAAENEKGADLKFSVLTNEDDADDEEDDTEGGNSKK